MRELLEHQLRALADESAPGLDVSCELVESADYAKALIERARELDVDLIATGPTSRTKLGYFVLGTTAEKLMRDSDCAVLAIHEP